jgi:hypothetical protein
MLNNDCLGAIKLATIAAIVNARNASAKKPLETQTHDRPQRPANVVTRRTTDRVQHITHTALQIATKHAVIMLGMTNRGFNRLTPL